MLHLLSCSDALSSFLSLSSLMKSFCILYEDVFAKLLISCTSTSVTRVASVSLILGRGNAAVSNRTQCPQGSQLHFRN